MIKKTWIIGIGLIGMLAQTGCATLNEKNADAEPIPVRKRNGIRAVYQIKTDGWKQGVGSGLHYVEKLADAYAEMGITADAFQISAVVHGEAGYHLLRDDAYRRETGKAEANPNKAIVKRLLDQGVSIELCAQTMKSRGWKAEDVLPGVRSVVGAYPRIIDLQQRGYAYIRF